MMHKIIGEPPEFAWSELIRKTPSQSIVSHWHQDRQGYYPIWICLDDVNRHNGTMNVKPGWHHKLKPHQCECSTINFHELGILQDDFEKDTIYYELPAGSAGIHTALLPHTAGSNQTDSDRRVIVLRYKGISTPDDFEDLESLN
eukprot:TRINITY_DN1776_c0_g1_i4.p1 TRINITY_DN1776_c0_g1~~TRINITY_DN1776_c0_g1_i4.p1  ORF type:complete len:144 (-),score=24.68 TRINITY_DN1776_c0_g1_i4:30-461(-)